MNGLSKKFILGTHLFLLRRNRSLKGTSKRVTQFSSLNSSVHHRVDFLSRPLNISIPITS